MSIANLVVAANGGVPLNALRPHNCHEAVLGWVLEAKYPSLQGQGIDPLSQGQGVSKAWLALRSLSVQYGQGNPMQLTGQWMSQKIYNHGYVKVYPPFSNYKLSVGDVLFMGNFVAPHHSMVVVQKNGIQALVRGFNNAGAFGGPYMAWDPVLRDITDMNRWNAEKQFLGINGPCNLYALTYNLICQNITGLLTHVNVLNTGHCQTCRQTHGRTPSIVNKWHQCTRCGTIYCPTHGAALGGKRGMFDQTRTCGVAGCMGRTRLW